MINHENYENCKRDQKINDEMKEDKLSAPTHEDKPQLKQDLSLINKHLKNRDNVNTPVQGIIFQQLVVGHGKSRYILPQQFGRNERAGIERRMGGSGGTDGAQNQRTQRATPRDDTPHYEECVCCPPAVF